MTDIINKKTYNNIIFDADGTLFDTLPGILAGFNFAMQKAGREPLTAEHVKPFMGPSIMETLQMQLGFSEKDARQVLEYYREFYWSKGYAMADLFDGVAQLLDDLLAAGCTLCIATNKPQVYIDKMLAERGMTDKFLCVAGPEFGDPSTDKTPLIKRAVAASGNAKSVMIGDRYVDIESAKSAGIDSIAVEWGSAEIGEFEKYKPTFIAKDAKQVLDIILGK